jgi:hypothetical protein
MKKAALGLCLGALLCFGLLVAAPQAAEAYVWNCSVCTITCVDFIVSGGALYQNTGVWCATGTACLTNFHCWYTRIA